MTERRVDKAELLAVYDWDTIRGRMLEALKKLGRDIPIVSEDDEDGREKLHKLPVRISM